MTARTNASRASRALLSSACLTGLVIKVPCNRALLERRLQRAGNLALGGTAGTTHPVYCELWNVHDGGFRVGDLDQHDISELAGEATGVAVGALAGAWAGALGGLRPKASGSDELVSSQQAFAFSVARGMRFGGTVIPSLWRSWSRRLAASVGSYRELCVWVPRVHVAGVRDAHSFVLGMLTDGKLARFADLALGYGYDKRPGRFAVVSPLDFEVSTGADASVVAFSGMSSSSRRVDASEVTEIEADWGNPLLGVTRSGRLARSQLRRSLSTATLLEGLGGELRAAHGFFPGGRSRYVFPEPTGDGGWHVLRFENVRADVGYPTSL